MTNCNLTARRKGEFLLTKGCYLQTKKKKRKACTHLICLIIGIHKERPPARWEGRTVNSISVVLSSDDSLSTQCIQDGLVLSSEREREKERVRVQQPEEPGVTECHKMTNLGETSLSLSLVETNYPQKKQCTSRQFN